MQFERLSETYNFLSHTVCDGFDNDRDNDNLYNVYEEIVWKTSTTTFSDSFSIYAVHGL